MIGFPFDSHVTFDADGSPVYDRAISSLPYRNLFKELFTNGISPKVSTNMQVVASENMTVNILSGFAIVEGCLKLEENTRTMAVQSSDTLDRIDTVVLRLNSNDDARICDFYVVKGTPATTPVRPTLTRTASIYEIGLADLFITANSTTISAAKITDTRFDDERCGIIAALQEIDTTTLDAQMNAWSQEQQAEFTAWVDSIKDILDEAAAGHLQNEIDDLTADIAEINDTLSNLITTTIASGDTSATITDEKITTTSIVDIYFKDKVLAPTSLVVTDGQIVLEIDAEETDTVIGIRII